MSYKGNLPISKVSGVSKIPNWPGMARIKPQERDENEMPGFLLKNQNRTTSAA